MRILWCVTGAGHFLAECVENFEKLSKKHYVTCVISNAGLEVAKAYGVLSKIKKLSKDVILEKQQGYSTPLSGSQKFDVAIVAPCTANTCAKIVGGVSDSAVSNITSQFLKRRIPVVILPTDYRKEIETTLPNGRKTKVYCKTVDIKNVENLKATEGVTVITAPNNIMTCLGDDVKNHQSKDRWHGGI